MTESHKRLRGIGASGFVIILAFRTTRRTDTMLCRVRLWG